MTDNPYREDIAGYLRRARCHYGARLRYQEAGFTVDEAARDLGIAESQVSNCRRGVQRVLDGVVAPNKSQASYDEAILRALKHFRDEMSPELRQHLDTRLSGLQALFNLTAGVEPLRCTYGFVSPATPTAPPRRESAPAPDDEHVPAAQDLSASDSAPEVSAPIEEAGTNPVRSPQQRLEMALDSHPNADDGWEFWAHLQAALPGRGIDGGHPTNDPFYFRFPGPAHIVPEMVGVVPGLRFSRSREHPLRPQSEMTFTDIAPDTRAELVDNQSRLQAEYQGNDEVIVRTSGDTKAYVEVVRTGSLLEAAEWPEYIDWFITTQLQLRAALQAVYGQFDFTGGNMATGSAAVKQVSVDKVLPAALKTELFEVKAMAERMASQPEAELGQRFEQYLSARGREVCCFTVKLPDGTVLTTDRCDVDGNVLYEAKSSADRMSVRLALGQILDYGRHVGRERADLRLAILLPAAPASDLVELLQTLGVGCVVEGPSGTFTDLHADAGGRSYCP